MTRLTRRQDCGNETERTADEQASVKGCPECDSSTLLTNIDNSLAQGLLSGKSPIGYAATAIYAATLQCDEQQTQREIAAIVQVTEVTIRNRYQEQIDAMDLS
jgi:transcription initiation factor TFIIB